MSDSGQTRHTAGAFDIRVIIAALIGVYGLILVLLGIFHDTAQERARADGLNINLWGGIGMVVVAALFVIWARARPVVVPDEPVGEDTHDGAHDGSREGGRDG